MHQKEITKFIAKTYSPQISEDELKTLIILIRNFFKCKLSYTGTSISNPSFSIFFKEVLLILLSPLSYIKYYSIMKESQVRDSPHVKSLRGVLNQHTLSDITVAPFNKYGNLPLTKKDPELLILVRSCDVYCRSTNTHKCCVIVTNFRL